MPGFAAVVLPALAVCAKQHSVNSFPDPADRLQLSPQGRCAQEPGRSYPSPHNSTALLRCELPRPERVCVVGGGLSGLHMAWLLRRRGFANTTVFEKEHMLGGKIRTHKVRRPCGNLAVIDGSCRCCNRRGCLLPARLRALPGFLADFLLLDLTFPHPLLLRCPFHCPLIR